MANFIYGIIERAKQDRKTIILAETKDPRVTEAASKIIARNIANIILIGDEEKIRKVTPEYPLDGAIFINPFTYEKIDEFEEQFYQLRKRKGVSREDAHEMMKNSIYFSMMLVKNGIADGFVGGAVTATANILRPEIGRAHV